MITWLKLDVGISTNAKVGAAGAHGALVFVAALCQHARHGAAGRIPARHMTPAALRIEAAALMADLRQKQAEAAIQRCVAAGLLAIDGDAVVLVDYDPEVSAPRCVRCHRTNTDPRFSTCPRCREARRVHDYEDGSECQRQDSDHASDMSPPSSRFGAARPDPDPTGPDRQEKTGPDGTGPDHQDRQNHHEPPAGEGSNSVTSSGSAGSGSEGSDPERLANILLQSTNWRSNSKERVVEVYKLAKRLESEGMTPDDLRTVWRHARRKAKDPSNPGGYFDSLVECEANWRSALEQARKADPSATSGIRPRPVGRESP